MSLLLVGATLASAGSGATGGDHSREGGSGGAGSGAAGELFPDTFMTGTSLAGGSKLGAGVTLWGVALTAGVLTGVLPAASLRGLGGTRRMLWVCGRGSRECTPRPQIWQNSKPSPSPEPQRAHLLELRGG